MKPISIIEQTVEAKTGDHRTCEDAIFIGKHHVAVIDGATAKSDGLIDGKSPGQIAQEVISNALLQLDGSEDGRTALRKITEVCSGLRTAWSQQQGRSASVPIATLVVYSKRRREIWRVGDCYFALNGRTSAQSSLVDRIASEARAAFDVACIQSGVRYEQLLVHDLGRDAILPLLLRQAAFMNNSNAGQYGYGAVDGTTKALDFLEIIDASGATDIVLASDGYPELLPSLAESEAKLASIISADPLLIYDWKATKGVTQGLKSFDDRAYLRISV